MPPTLLAKGTLTIGDEPAPRPGRAIDEVTAWVRARLPELGRRGAAFADRVLVLQAKTGTGKSTVMPVELFRTLRTGAPNTERTYAGRHVLCCQPKVMTAVTLATEISSPRMIDGQRVVLNPDIVMGKTVGYQTGPLKTRRHGGIIYATIGVLAAQLRSMSDAELMMRYRAIIIDEAHERSLEADLTLTLLRDFFQRNLGDERLPFVLIASATFDPVKMAAFFGLGSENVMRVEGASHPVATVWPAAPPAGSAVSAAVAKVRQVHEANPGDEPARADMLVFVPGAAESADIVSGLELLNKEYAAAGAGSATPAPLLVLAVDSAAVADETESFRLVFAPAAALPAVGGRRPSRRVVIATTVAETGLTIDTLKYVIDHGWNRTAETYFPWGFAGLLTRPAARSRLLQRRGRVGRIFPGEFHPLYTEPTFNALDAQQLPDVAVKGVGDIFLALVRAAQKRAALAAGMSAAAIGLPGAALPGVSVEPGDLGMPEAPPVAAVAHALWTATALGTVARVGAGWGLTPLGVRAAMLERMPPFAARALLAGCAWRAAASDLLTVAAVLVEGGENRDFYTQRESREPGTGSRALLASLPAALAPPAGAVLVEGARGAPTDEGHRALLRTRLALADDFAEIVLVFDKFAERARDCVPRGAAGHAELVAWCAALGLNFDALVTLATARASAAGAMAAAGLDPCRDDDRRLAVAPAATFGAVLRAFKRCMYDAMRPNLIRRTPNSAEKPAYLSSHGVSVVWQPWAGLRVSAAAAGLKLSALPQPALAIASGFLLKPVPDMIRYAPTVQLVSVLDGFLAVDPGLDRAADAAAPVAGGAASEIENDADDAEDERPLDLF
jgi:HrpA-like RNA helicase